MNQYESLKEAMSILEGKEDEYGSAPHTIGPVLHAMFPNGVHINSIEDWARMATFMNCVAKLNRYAANIWQGGHEDSALDLINYAAMLRARTNYDSK